MKAKHIVYFFFAVILLSCHKDCDRFNYNSCPPHTESFIIVKFNLDSANGGFSPSQIQNVEWTYAKEYYSEKRAPLSEYMYYYPSTGIFQVMYSFYCCTSQNAGIKFFNNNTGTIHAINNVKYTVDRPYDYCCGEYYFVNTFKYDGITKNRADTIIINND